MSLQLFQRKQYKKWSFVLIWFLIGAGGIDAFVTDTGIRLSYIGEKNPIMQMIYQESISGFYIFKLLCPMLLWILFYKMKNISTAVYLLLSGTCGLYLWTLCLHIYWISLVGFTKYAAGIKILFVL